jgi:hypothetical protein
MGRKINTCYNFIYPNNGIEASKNNLTQKCPEFSDEIVYINQASRPQ